MNKMLTFHATPTKLERNPTSGRITVKAFGLPGVNASVFFELPDVMGLDFGITDVFEVKIIPCSHPSEAQSDSMEIFESEASSEGRKTT